MSIQGQLKNPAAQTWYKLFRCVMWSSGRSLPNTSWCVCVWVGMAGSSHSAGVTQEHIRLGKVVRPERMPHVGDNPSRVARQKQEAGVAALT
jgi:hypothetical protein